MEYSAGLIQTAQPLYAIKLLSIAVEKSEVSEWTEDNVEKSITNKGIILALMGLYLFISKERARKSLLNFSHASLFNLNKAYTLPFELSEKQCN